MTKKPLWIPSEKRVSEANITRFIDFVNKKHDSEIKNYQELYDYSVTEIEKFWEDIFEFADLTFSGTYQNVLSERIMPGGKWFEGLKLNYAENIFKKLQNEFAITSYREGFGSFRITSDKFKSVSLKLASALKAAGVGKGDRVASFSSNIPEAVMGLMATSTIGAIWSSCSPDFGTQAVIDRFGQIDPKILFAVESYDYNGKRFNCMPKIIEITRAFKSLEKVVLIPAFQDFDGETVKYSHDLPNNFVYFDDFIEEHDPTETFEQVEFSHPLYILYSSGTTGKPKCIVHGTGGTMLQHYKELALHTDLKVDDKLLYFTTTGWMMWNWLVSGLLVGAEIVLFDGSVVYPNASILWKFVSEQEVSVFGTSPKFLSLTEKNEIKPLTMYNYNKLKAILSTGSPLLECNFEWVYKNVKKDLQLSSISGGTDIVSCFMLGCPILPVISGEIQGRGLGMKVEVFDESGKLLEGEKGELVCSLPFPSMPVEFWNDEGDVKYKDAYFSRYPGVWRHGDYIRITKNGGVIVYGRSDATLNPGGVRIGTAEIYRIVEEIPEIEDSIVAGINVKDEIEIFLFVVLKSGCELSPDLVLKIKKSLKEKASPRHVPHRIFKINDVPRTISGKKVEIAITKIFAGEEPDNREALANPASLDVFESIKLMVVNP